GQFLAFCRDALHLALSAAGGDASRAAPTDLPAEEAQALAALAREAGYENLLRLMNQLLASEETVRRSEAGALAVEIAWLRAAELPKLTRIEELLAGAVASGSASHVPGGGRALHPASHPSSQRESSPLASAPPASLPPPAPSPARGDGSQGA